MVAIYGYSNSSLELATLLKRRRMKYIIVVDSEDEQEEVKAHDFDARILDLTKDQNLIELGVKGEIDTLVCMHRDYNKNLFVTLSARKLNDKLTIISRSTTVDDAKKLELAGASFTVSPYDLGSHRIFRMIKKPNIFKVLDQIIYSDMPIDIREIKIPQNSHIIGVEFHKLDLEERYDIEIIGVQSQKSAKFYYNTHKVYRKIAEGDILVIIGDKKNISKLQKGISG